MRRILCVFLLFLTLLSLAACGGAGSSEFRYSIPSYDRSEIEAATGNFWRILTEGAVATLELRNVLGKDIVFDESIDSGVCIFDDRTKTLIPLCFDAICEHNDLECFSQKLIFGHIIPYVTVIDDAVTTTDCDNNTFTVKYYGFSGNVIRDIEFELSALKLPDGESAEVYSHGFVSRARYGITVYLDFMNYNDETLIELQNAPEGEDILFYHWVVSWDLKTGEIEPVAGFEVPDPYVKWVIFTECNEDRLVCTYGGVNGYIVDLSSGSVEVLDFSSVIDRLVASGAMPEGSRPSGYNLKRDLFGASYIDDNYSRVRKYFDADTFEEYVPTETELLELTRESTVFIESEEYYFKYVGLEDCQFELVNSKTGEKTEVNYGADDFDLGLSENGTKERYLQFAFESEKGLVYTVKTRVMDGTGIWGENCETRIVNGEEVTFLLYDELIYWDKSDMLDGTIDEPWYYQPETGTFGQ